MKALENWKYYLAFGLFVLLACTAGAYAVVAFGVLTFAGLSGDDHAAGRGLEWLLRACLLVPVVLAVWAIALRLRRSATEAREPRNDGALPTVAMILPPATNTERARYATRCLADVVRRGEAPEVLSLHDRKMGIQSDAAGAAAYIDLGVTPDMQTLMNQANEDGQPVDLRRLPDWRAAEGGD